MTLALALPLGLLIGLVMGALGGGGAILAVPVFVYLLGQDPHTASASSLVVVGVGALAGMADHLRAKNVRMAAAVAFGGLGIVGNYAGTLLAHGVDGRLLMGTFAVLLVVVAGAMAQRLRAGRSSGTGALSLREFFASPRRAILLLVTATLTGMLTGFFGVGGGFMIVPALTLVLDFTIKEAVGSSLLVIALNCLFAFVPRILGGTHLDWILVATLTVMSMLGTVLGARLGRRANPRTLQIGFICLLLGIAVYTIVRVIG